MGNLNLFKAALVLTAVVKAFGYVAFNACIFHFSDTSVKFKDEIKNPVKISVHKKLPKKPSGALYFFGKF